MRLRTARVHVLASLFALRRVRALHGKRKVLRVATKGEARAYAHVHRAADKYASHIKAAAKKAFTASKKAVSQSALAAATTEQDALSAIDPGITAFAATFEAPFSKAFAKIIKESGRATAKRVTSGQVFVKVAAKKSTPKIDFVFDHTNPNVLDYIREHTAETIEDISTATRNKVKEIIARAFEEQHDLKDYADELTAALGDADRADLVARTESMTAANEGQAEAWDQAVEAGLLNGDEKKTWIVADDQALCPICEGLADQTVAMDANFESPDSGEQFDGPPAHPRCRCTVGLVAGGE